MELQVLTDRIRSAWSSLSEATKSKAKTFVLLLYISCTILWVTYAYEAIRTMKSYRYSTPNSWEQARDEEVAKISLAYERLTDEEANSEWLQQSHFASTPAFRLIYGASRAVAAMGWLRLFHEVIERVLSPLMKRHKHQINRSVGRIRDAIFRVLDLTLSVLGSAYRFGCAERQLVLVVALTIGGTYATSYLEHQYVKMEDPYQVLQLGDDHANITRQEIKRAYKRLMLRYYHD